MQSEGEHPSPAVAPIQMNNPASASSPRVDDEHRGPAVEDALELSWCRIALLEASGGWPIPDDLPPLLVEFSQSIPEDQRSDWLQRQTASEEVTRLISYAMRSGELPIWIAPKDGPERLVAPSAMLEVDHATVVSGCYRPPNDQGWLYGRPLFVKRSDWSAFVENVAAAKTPLDRAGSSPPPPPIGAETDAEQLSDTGWLKGLPGGWVEGQICARRLFQRFKIELNDDDPAPWVEIGDAEDLGKTWGQSAAEYTYNQKMNERVVAIFQRAICTGELGASWFDGVSFREIPRSAFQRRGIAYRAIFDGRVEVDPSWPDDWQHWNYHGWAIPKDAFDTWLASGRPLELDALPNVGAQAEIAPINRRFPSDARRVSLSEAVTWIAFGMALDSERLARAVQWGRLCDGDLRAAQGKLEKAATALLTAGTDGQIAFIGRHVESRDQRGSLTRPIDPLALADYRLIEIYHHDSLHYGTGFKHEYRTPIDTILHGSDRDDYYSEVAVERAELMKLFPANEPDAAQTKNDPIVWTDFGPDAEPELARLKDRAGHDEWWSWPEAIAWVGSLDLRNIATLRYWGAWWRSQPGGDDPTIILAGQDDIARRFAADAETRLVAAIERGSVGTSGRSARDARASRIDKDDWRGGIVAYGGGTANLVSRKNLNTVWAFDIEVSRAGLLAHFPATNEAAEIITAVAGIENRPDRQSAGLWADAVSTDWMPYSEACVRARLSTGAEIEPEGDSGTSALLARANDGLIAIGSQRSERMIEPLGGNPESRAFDRADGAVFMELLYASYHSLPGQDGGEQWAPVYINHAAGDFKFELENSDPAFRVTYSVWGMRFGRTDVEDNFPLAVKASNAVSNSKGTRGRTKGTGYQKADAPLLEEMRLAIESDASLNATSAARLVATKAKGASYEANVDRLARAYRAGKNGE